MELGQFLGFLAATAVGLGLSIATFLFARKAGLASVQSTLIQTLKDNSDALKKRVDILEGEMKSAIEENILLKAEVKRLGETVVSLAKENSDLKVRLASVPTVTTTTTHTGATS